jgi:hypothetical protein
MKLLFPIRGLRTKLWQRTLTESAERLCGNGAGNMGRGDETALFEGNVAVADANF